MKKLGWFLSVYRQYIRISFSSAAAYRANFFFTVIISLLSNLLVPLVTVLIYAGGASIPGWSFHEALLIQSVFMLCTGICAPLFGNMVWITMEHVREGSYDLLMLKPGPTVFITMASSFDLENLGAFIGGLGMFVYAVRRVPVAGVGGWAVFCGLFLMGVCMTLGCILVMAATTFKWVGNSRIYEIYDAVTMFGRYPGTVFSGPLRVLITYVVPVSMLGFFPAAAILGRATSGMYLAVLPCGAFLVLGWLLFRRMIHLYQSGGG